MIAFQHLENRATSRCPSVILCLTRPHSKVTATPWHVCKGTKQASALQPIHCKKWQRNGRLKYWNLCLGCHCAPWETDGRTCNRFCTPRVQLCPCLPVGELFVREPPPELVACFATLRFEERLQVEWIFRSDVHCRAETADGDSDFISACIFVILMVLCSERFRRTLFAEAPAARRRLAAAAHARKPNEAKDWKSQQRGQHEIRITTQYVYAYVQNTDTHTETQMIGQATFNHWVTPQHERLSETGNALVKYCDNVSILSRQPDGNIEFDNIGTYRHTKMHVHQSPRRSPDVHSYFCLLRSLHHGLATRW